MNDQRYNHKGLPSDLIHYDTDGVSMLNVETNINGYSVPNLYTGNVIGEILVAPPSGCRLKIKALTIIGEGNIGSAKIYRSSSSVTILPCYFAFFKPSTTSSSFNMILEEDEYLYLTTESRGSDQETFVGVSYIILNC